MEVLLNHQSQEARVTDHFIIDRRDKTGLHCLPLGF